MVIAQILLRIDDAESKLLQKKAAELGLSTSAFVRQILKDSLRKSTSQEPAYASLKNARAQVVVLAEAIGRTTQGVSPEATEKLKKTLLRIFDQEVGK